jgi:putative ABC transport system substrate-binding protein
MVTLLRPHDRMHARTVRAVLVVTGVVALALVAAGQPAARVPRVGVLLPGAPPPPEPAQLVALRKGLRDLGFEDGRDVVIEARYGSNDPRRLAEMARELVGGQAALLVTSGDLSTRLAMQATTSIPIVAIVGDPVLSGFVASFARPGGNVTGVGMFVYELASKRLELLREVAPRVRRVGVLWDRALHPTQLEEVREASRALKLELQVRSAGRPAHIEQVLEALAQDRVDGLFVAVSPMFQQARQLVVDVVTRTRLPAVYPDSIYAEAGGLLSYGPNISDVYAQSVAGLVERILKGAKPGDLPVERPTRVELVVNGKTARALGLTIPSSLLLRADQVLE